MKLVSITVKMQIFAQDFESKDKVVEEVGLSLATAGIPYDSIEATGSRLYNNVDGKDSPPDLDDGGGAVGGGSIGQGSYCQMHFHFLLE